METSSTSSTTEEMSGFLHALKKEPERRSHHDVQTLYFTLRSFTCLDRYDDNTIYNICAKNCYYHRKQANDILYCRGEIAHQWFILISGSVFIDGSMFLPITSFGRRPQQSNTLMLTRRPNECLILEPSEMICIDYFDSQTTSIDPLTSLSNRNSLHSSDDTSSAYSGSDTMLSSSHSTNRHHNYQQNYSNPEIDLSGLLESVVDSASCSENSSHCSSRSSSPTTSLSFSVTEETHQNTVRECLEKDPSERNEGDIATLLEFTQHLSAFHDLTLTVRRSLCAAMVFAVVEKAGTVVLTHGEELDSWSVLVNGSVEVSMEGGGGVSVLSAGDSFGLPPTLDKQYFCGSMRTRVDDCQFVCVTQGDYFRILKQGLDNQLTIRDPITQKPILIYESRANNHGNQLNQPHTPYYSPFIVIRGTKSALINELFKQENGSVDPTFVEDFLLTQRIFMDIHELAEKIIINFSDVAIRDRVTRVMLLWVNNHFIDFEVDWELMQLLERFHSLLSTASTPMSGQLRLLQIACSAKSRPRTVTISRPSRDTPLPFNVMGGADNGYGIFVSSVESSASTSSGSSGGIRVGDELISVNSVNFKSVNLARALEVLQAATHLVVVVKCNFLGYHECISSSAPLIPQTQQQQKPPPPTINLTTKRTPKSLNKHGRFKKALQRINLLPKKSINVMEKEEEVEIQPKIDFPENVLRVYRPDQSNKYFLVNKETTAREVVMLALQEFSDHSPSTTPSRDYALFQVSVNSINSTLMLKQTRLPDNLDSLAERLQLGARYYIKKQDSTEPLVPTELLSDLFKESEVGLLNLNPTELALQLTLEDYACFRQIEMTEFIDDLFNLKTSYGTPNLSQFAQLVNRETFWVVTEIVKETSVTKRVLIIKRFVKVAMQCRECRNFNSMFAIVSGLGHSAVTRLKGTWDKLSGKYSRLFKDLQDLMDPSRNMHRYRSLLSSSFQTPMIPFYPVVKKDLTFIDLGNSSTIDEMINFEKMRMVSKEIRSLIQMSAAPFDTSGLASVAAMNQLANVSSGRSTLTTTTGKKVGGGGGGFGNKKKKTHQHPTNNPPPQSSSLPNPKKMYSEMNMIRKVKAYLHRLKITEDENLLHELSNICESTATTNNTFSGSSTSVSRATLKKPGSPTLSTTSSNASEGQGRVKFGSASYQKLLALSEPSLQGAKGVKSRLPPVPLSGFGGDRQPHPQPPTTATTATTTPHIPPSMTTNNNNLPQLLPLSTESSSVLPGTK